MVFRTYVRRNPFLLRRAPSLAAACAALDGTRVVAVTVVNAVGVVMDRDGRPVAGEVARDRYRGFRSGFVEHLCGLGVAASDARRATDHLITAIDGIAVEALFDPGYGTAARQRRHLRDVIATVLPDLSVS